MSNEKTFIPEITVNNTKEEREVTIDGVEQKVEVPAQQGFNIKTKSLEGDYQKGFFVKDLEAVILFDRYQIQSKYNVKPMFMSNEFEFSGSRNNVRVYCPEKKEVLYEGPYSGAKDFFATGQITSAGTPEKSFDTFSILYLLIDGEVFRFRWKMNQNNTWFSYKDGAEDERGDRGYRGIKTKFALEKKKFGSNEFWACHLENVGKVDRTEADEIGDKLEDDMDEEVSKFKKGANGDSPQTVMDLEQIPMDQDTVDVDSIPF